MAEVTVPSPIEAPPPAYEISQLNFDQKLAIAAERSLDLSERRHEYEQDASSEACEGASEGKKSDASKRPGPRLKALGNAQRPSVPPLTFRKKARNSEGEGALFKEKELPSWLSDAQLVPSSTSSMDAPSRALPMPAESREPDWRGPYQHDDILSEDLDEDCSIPPPPFAATDDSLDGPAYERYAANNVFRRRPGGTIVLRYTGEDPAPPRPPTAHLSSQRPHRRHHTASPPINSTDIVYQCESQQSGLHVRAPVVRPRSAEPHRHIPPPPRLSFDPSVAYEGTKSSSMFYGQLPEDPRETAGDVTALYSSAVAPLLAPQKALPAAKENQYAPSVSSLPGYDQHQHIRSIPASKSSYSVQASRASVYTQSSVHIPQYPQVAQYPETAQYPTRQNYNRPMYLGQQEDRQRWSTVSGPHQSQYNPR